MVCRVRAGIPLYDYKDILVLEPLAANGVVSTSVSLCSSEDHDDTKMGGLVNKIHHFSKDILVSVS